MEFCIKIKIFKSHLISHDAITGERNLIDWKHIGIIGEIVRLSILIGVTHTAHHEGATFSEVQRIECPLFEIARKDSLCIHASFSNEN
jgi:hypothetical protein